MRSGDRFLAQQPNNRDEKSTKALSGTWLRDQHFLAFYWYQAATNRQTCVFSCTVPELPTTVHAPVSVTGSLSRTNPVTGVTVFVTPAL